MEWNEKILESAKQGNLDTIKKCLANGANVNAKDKKFGTTPLMYASYGGNGTKQRLEIVKYLISKGASINAKSNCGDTALDRAKKYFKLKNQNDNKIIKYLKTYSYTKTKSNNFGISMQ